ncbi:hypothetical protein Aduo_016652 [Ancylostoma duodenale]
MKLPLVSLFLLLLIVDVQHAVDNLSAEDGNMTAGLANETSSLKYTVTPKKKYKRLCPMNSGGLGIGGLGLGGLGLGGLGLGLSG